MTEILYHYVLRLVNGEYSLTISPVEYQEDFGRLRLLNNLGKRFLYPNKDLNILVSKSSYSMYSFSNKKEDYFLSLVIKAKLDIKNNLEAKLLDCCVSIDKLKQFKEVI